MACGTLGAESLLIVWASRQTEGESKSMEATSETLVCGTLRGESLLPDWAFRQLEGELLLMEAESQDLLGFQLWDCMVSSSC